MKMLLLSVGILLVGLLGCQAMPVAESREKPSAVTKFNSSRPHVGGGTYGVDISSYMSVTDFQCLKKNGFEFVIPRAYQSNGKWWIFSTEVEIIVILFIITLYRSSGSECSCQHQKCQGC